MYSIFLDGEVQVRFIRPPLGCPALLFGSITSFSPFSDYPRLLKNRMLHYFSNIPTIMIAYVVTILMQMYIRV